MFVVVYPNVTHAVFIPMAVVYPHTAITVMQLSVKSFAAHQFHNFGKYSHPALTLALARHLSKTTKKISQRGRHFMLERICKVQAM